MKIDLSMDTTPDEVVDLLNETGVVRIKNFTNQYEIIKQELMTIYDEMAPNYQFGKTIRTDHNTWDVSKTPKTNIFFRGSEWMFEVYQKYQSGPIENFQRDLFSSYDFISHSGIGPQGWSHFDKLQRLKFFLYLTDVDENQGPFRCDPGTQKITKVLRSKEVDPTSPTKWRFGRYYGDPGFLEENDWAPGSINSSQNHYPDIEYDLKDITGPAGTLIIFDSDVIHCGGQVREGGSRIVARAHSW